MKATKDQLRKEIEELRLVGLQLANCAYNLAQRSPSPHEHDLLDRLRREWDAIARSEKP